MRNEIVNQNPNTDLLNQDSPVIPVDLLPEEIISEHGLQFRKNEYDNDLPEILFITTYPPRVCGIATYSFDLIKALNNKFGTSFSINVCALEAGYAKYNYPDEVKYVLNTSHAPEYKKLANYVNQNNRIKIVLIQHEFGFFQTQTEACLQFLYELKKPVIVVFHTVLPHPGKELITNVKSIVSACESVVVMTHNSEQVLIKDYDVPQQKISIIAHGTHLVQHLSEKFLKEKYGLAGNMVLSTFGLLSSGKSIETTIEALPAIVRTNPEVVFLVIGKTHPEVIKSDGEKYRDMLVEIVNTLNLHRHVRFINSYLELPVLLEYLQLTDIYLFTSKDPNQAVSGTFSYAMSCSCPIISTPIPHALEVINDNNGIIIDFQNSQQLAKGVIKLLNDEPLRKNISTNTLQKIVSTAWENSAVAHAMLLEKISCNKILPQYSLPAINLDHTKKLTTDFGIIQFSKVNQPDIDSGYTLDDNARALIAMCMHFEMTGEESDLVYLQTYLNFINHCLQPAGDFLNYVNKDKKFSKQNTTSNLDDANGRAIWALGYFISKKAFLPAQLISEAEAIIEKALSRADVMLSTRAMAFAIKGLYYYNIEINSPEIKLLIVTLANRLVQMYKHESAEKWNWFESYLTYANSILPEAMLYAWLLTDDLLYKTIAKESLEFLLSNIFNENGIEVISNKNWLNKGQEAGKFGEQPIDVAYTIMTLSRFYDVFNEKEYLDKMTIAFNWFLGNNRLHQIIYNPCTGGCYDGLEENHVNLNQGAESTLSYLMARLSIDKYKNLDNQHSSNTGNHIRARTKLRKRIYSTENKNSPDMPLSRVVLKNIEDVV
jgi:glycosyltransferase involved in cell wall biosynthesis